MNAATEDGTGPWDVLRELRTLRETRLANARILGKEPNIEACLRRVLRPHDEAGFEAETDQWMIGLRGRLDRACDELVLREIREQLGIRNQELAPEIREDLRFLFRSEAFFRYVNAYLYFGVRFLASRESDQELFGGEQVPNNTDTNVRFLRLLHPPPLSGSDLGDHFEKFMVDLQLQESWQIALRFLDDFHLPRKQSVQYELEEPSEFELWLRGLRPEISAQSAARFEAISKGMEDWVTAQSNFYRSLDPPATALILGETGEEAKGQQARPVEGWIVKHPIAPRLALFDVYWMARLLRADVSEDASVRYRRFTWVHLLRFRALLAQDSEKAASLKIAEDTIRSVFSDVCDLIQNSVELTAEDDRRRMEPCKFPAPPSQTLKWRAAFDEELDEIDKQRRVRHFIDPSLGPLGEEPEDPIVWHGGNEPGQPPSSGAQSGSPPPGDSTTKGWSARIWGADRPRNLIGLAFSGGGIRSATFNLGLLQGLQELDLLRHVDYVSTVSGGGFIGSWLVANVRRTRYWLGRLTDWSASIKHLRSYSNYLAPRTGILSADTWNLVNSWLRNALLIQLTGLAWLFVLLLATLCGLRIFVVLAGVSRGDFPWAGGLALCMGIFLTITVFYNLNGTDGNSNGAHRSSHWVRLLAVTPAWIGAFAMASQFWADAPSYSPAWGCLNGLSHYSEIFFAAWRAWLLIICAAGAAFFLIAFLTLERQKLWALLISPLCTLTLYLELVAIFMVFRAWSSYPGGNELAFAFGPPFVLLAFSVVVLLIIGFTGRNTGEGLREWWTRFGTWLSIFSGAGVFLSAVAVFSPRLVPLIFGPIYSDHRHLLQSVKWTSILGWLGTVIGGLFAGKSGRTSGDSNVDNSTALEILAKVGGFLFILGAFLSGSMLLYFLMFEIFASEDSIIPTNCFRVLAEFHSGQIPEAFVLTLVLGWLFSWFFDINIFGFNQFYRHRLVRCYLGATRWTPGLRNPNPFTKFDFHDDLNLSRLRTDSHDEDRPEAESDPYRGPFPLINCTLNLGGSSDLSLNTRHSDSFTLTPLHCGCNRPAVGYAPTFSEQGSFADGVQLGQAVAISGAAVNPNMGYNTSPLVAFLLTLFNVRLGWWFPNPGQAKWSRRGLGSSLYYLVMELFGIANETRQFLNTSDGGHFENLGIYELVRRRAKLIIAGDAECDEQLHFGGLGNLIRICETDFGAIIDVDVKSIRPRHNGLSLVHCAVGDIKYSNGDIGTLIYLKASITGDEDADIAQYRSDHPSFPHETTANQFYSEDQFESYRKLGLHIVRASFKGNIPGDHPLMVAQKMRDVLTPAGAPLEAFLRHTDALKTIWTKFRLSDQLLPLMTELMTITNIGQRPAEAVPTDRERCICLELIQLMEEVFLDLQLDDFWEHPDNRGWAILFMRWARSPRFRAVWKETRRTFGIRFEYFCSARLGLERDAVIVRV